MHKIEYDIIRKTPLVEKLIALENSCNSVFDSNLYNSWDTIAKKCINENSIVFANGYHEELDTEELDAFEEEFNKDDNTFSSVINR